MNGIRIFTEGTSKQQPERKLFYPYSVDGLVDCFWNTFVGVFPNEALFNIPLFVFAFVPLVITRAYNKIRGGM